MKGETLMRNTLGVALLILCALSFPASAQVDDGGDTGCGMTYPCDSDFPDETGSGGGSTLQSCKMIGGCPICTTDFNTRQTVCSVSQGQTGHCKCTPNGTMTDKYGRTIPRCTTEGGCTSA